MTRGLRKGDWAVVYEHTDGEAEPRLAGVGRVRSLSVRDHDEDHPCGPSTGCIHAILDPYSETIGLYPLMECWTPYTVHPLTREKARELLATSKGARHDMALRALVEMSGSE